MIARETRIDTRTDKPVTQITGAQSGLLIRDLDDKERNLYDASLDGISALRLTPPANQEEEDKLVRQFLSGFQKLFSRDYNWTFWQPLTLSVESCVGCRTCSEACPVYLASGRREIYRPNFRLEILRSLKQRYLDKNGAVSAAVTDRNIELNWATLARLAELSYRCTLCRRCAQVCPMGADNGLVAREIRKMFSQEMGIAPAELHASGTVQHLKGTSPAEAQSFAKMVHFIENEIKDKTGKTIHIPVDKKGADFLFIQTSMESPMWLKCPECFAIIFEAAGLNWTLSSKLGFGGMNFGVWYDDIQMAKIVFQQSHIARELGVKKIVLGECGHAYKGLAGLADRMLTGEANIPRLSWLNLVLDIIESGKLRLDPARNNFPVTLHDPCNIVRHMGIVEPQRQILKRICPQFREMTTSGVHNYCCGGGGGLILLGATNFPEWRVNVSGKMKVEQIIQAFSDVPDPNIKKYICAPCFTCKLQIKDMFRHFGVWDKHGISCGGLVELIVNAMADIKSPFLRLDSSC